MKLSSPNNMKTPACRSIRGQLVKKLILLKKQRNGNIDRSFAQRDLNYRPLLALPLGELAAEPTERAENMTIPLPSQSPAVTALPEGEPSRVSCPFQKRQSSLTVSTPVYRSIRGYDVYIVLINAAQTTPCAIIASATLRKPATFAPTMRSPGLPHSTDAS